MIDVCSNYPVTCFNFSFKTECFETNDSKYVHLNENKARFFSDLYLSFLLMKLSLT